MQGLIRDAIKPADRPSTGKLDKLPDGSNGKVYQYLATQGS